MNNSINLSTFIDDLINSDDDYEPYGLASMQHLYAASNKDETPAVTQPLFLQEMETSKE